MNDRNKKTENVIELTSQLPIENQMILQYLCSFLSRVARFAEINKMGLSNIATW